MLLGFIDDNLVSTSHISSPFRSRVIHNAEISISVKREYWSMGIGTAGMKELNPLRKIKEQKTYY